MVTRIRAASSLPLSVDMEAGYGNSAEEIADNLRRLAQTGVAGVNLEDSRVINGVRQLDDASDFSRNLRAVCDTLRSENYTLFLNIRLTRTCSGMKTRCRRRYYGVNAIKLQVLTAFCSLPDVRERHQPHCRGNGVTFECHVYARSSVIRQAETGRGKPYFNGQFYSFSDTVNAD